jgi:glycosyltransferase involved in cell wall biosynthesis
MKILIIAMAHSVHTARWINQFSDQDLDIHLFPSIDNRMIHPELKNVTVHYSAKTSNKAHYQNVKFYGSNILYRLAVFVLKRLMKDYLANYRVLQLKNLIKRIEPDIIHSIEFQHAGYLTLQAKHKIKNKFPKWLVTNWGSDIYLFGRLSEHKEKINKILSECDYYSCECQRDVLLAKNYGLKGRVLPVYPNTGGFDLKLISQLRQSSFPSNRRAVMLKGYQHWAGRALVGLRALERCADLLKKYEIIIHSASPDVQIAAELFHKSSFIKTTILPESTSHKEILRAHGKARISIGLSISDAISTSFLESIAMGSFPIQSWTSCADEWIKNGKTGFLVPPDDPDVVEQSIRRALTDDELVDKAAIENYKTVKDRLDKDILKPKIIKFYKTIYEGNPNSNEQ